MHQNAFISNAIEKSIRKMLLKTISFLFILFALHFCILTNFISFFLFFFIMVLVFSSLNCMCCVIYFGECIYAYLLLILSLSASSAFEKKIKNTHKHIHSIHKYMLLHSRVSLVRPYNQFQLCLFL